MTPWREAGLEVLEMAGSANKISRYIFLSAELTSPIIAGAVLGYYLDGYFSTSPYLTLAAFLMGVFTGFYRLFKALEEFKRSQ